MCFLEGVFFLRGESHMSLRISTTFCTKVRKVTKKKGTDSRTEEEEKASGQHNPVPKFTKIVPKTKSTTSKKGKQKTALV